jgi:hypothetical protein
MTQIVPGLPLPPAGSTAATLRAPALSGGAWMKELERARWEAQPRLRPGEGGAAGENAEQHARGFEPLPASAAARDAQAPQSRANEARPAQAVGPAAADLPVSTAAFLARTGTGKPPGAAWNHTLAATERIRQEVLRAVKAHERSGPGEPWSARNVHVQTAGESWAIWIRDAGITPERVREMLDAIERLAGDGGSRRAIRLTVNGQPFAAGPDSSKEPQAAGERLGN